VVAVARGPATTSGVLMVTIAPDDRTSIAWRPAVLRDGVASAVDGSGASSATHAWEDLRGCTDLQPSHGNRRIQDLITRPAAVGRPQSSKPSSNGA
jgi:hypothetical protein